jgi:hypothetical protein
MKRPPVFLRVAVSFSALPFANGIGGRASLEASLVH